MTFSRFFLKEANDFFEILNSKKINRVAIYGAGAAGAQLSSTLSMTGKSMNLAYFDDNSNLHIIK